MKNENKKSAACSGDCANCAGGCHGKCKEHGKGGKTVINVESGGILNYDDALRNAVIALTQCTDVTDAMFRQIVTKLVNE